MMNYELKLANFEGPLDLLLHLISKAKIEPKDIFVSEITEQYLSYMEDEQLRDLETASEFLQMAATLVYIKSRALLPRTRFEVEEEDGMTIEDQLVARLNEYKRYKEAAERLKQMEEDAEGHFFKFPEELAPDDAPPVIINANVIDLFAAYKDLLAQVKETENERVDGTVAVVKDAFSVRAQMRHIMAKLTIKDKMDFRDLFSDRPTREELAVTFYALLELLAQSRVGVSQKQVFGPIDVYKMQMNLEEAHG